MNCTSRRHGRISHGSTVPRRQSNPKQSKICKIFPEAQAAKYNTFGRGLISFRASIHLAYSLPGAAFALFLACLKIEFGPSLS